MDVSGWIVRTDKAGRYRYWKVGEIDPNLAARIARETAGAQTAKTLSRIAAPPLPQFKVAPGVATELWKRPSNTRMSEQPNTAAEFDETAVNTLGEITFDVVVREEGARIVEGCYRIDGEDWKVFLLAKESDAFGSPCIKSDAVFESGISGIYGVVAADLVLNKQAVLRILTELVGVDTWTEVKGPNSLVLR
jgi:hypothetical protein